MSGPIIRKYGFPNFESIFGKREPQHGVEDETPAGAGPKAEEAPAPEKPGPPKPAEPGKG